MVASRRRLFSIGKQHGDSSEKLKIELPYDPAVPLLGIYPKELKTLILKDTCIPMFIAALLITAKTWKQHKCPLTDEWIKKMCHMCVCVCVHMHTHTHIRTHNGILLSHKKEWGFPGRAVVENLPANAGDTGSSPGLGRSHMPRSGWAREPQLLSLRVWSLCPQREGP